MGVSGSTASQQWYERASDTILLYTPVLADRIMALHFERVPELENSYGERQRAFYLEDTRSSLGALSAAMLLETPDIFADYVLWLVSLLKARNIPTKGLPTHFECMRKALQEVMPEDLRTKTEEYLDTGIKALSEA